MKKILLAVGTAFLTLTALAQSSNDYIEMTREVIKAEKKAAIAEVMNLTDAESQPFWDLYNEYQGKQYPVHNKRIAIIKDFADNYENLTDEKADELWTNYMKFQQELLKVKISYYKKLKKILPAGKAALFMQTENKIEALINASLAAEIPLIETR